MFGCSLHRCFSVPTKPHKVRFIDELVRHVNNQLRPNPENNPMSPMVAATLQDAQPAPEPPPIQRELWTPTTLRQPPLLGCLVMDTLTSSTASSPPALSAPSKALLLLCRHVWLLNTLTTPVEEEVVFDLLSTFDDEAATIKVKPTDCLPNWMSLSCHQITNPDRWVPTMYSVSHDMKLQAYTAHKGFTKMHYPHSAWTSPREDASQDL